MNETYKKTKTIISILFIILIVSGCLMMIVGTVLLFTSFIATDFYFRFIYFEISSNNLSMSLLSLGLGTLLSTFYMYIQLTKTVESFSFEKISSGLSLFIQYVTVKPEIMQVFSKVLGFISLFLALYQVIILSQAVSNPTDNPVLLMGIVVDIVLFGFFTNFSTELGKKIERYREEELKLINFLKAKNKCITIEDLVQEYTNTLDVILLILKRLLLRRVIVEVSADTGVMWCIGTTY